MQEQAGPLKSLSDVEPNAGTLTFKGAGAVWDLGWLKKPTPSSSPPCSLLTYPSLGGSPELWARVSNCLKLVQEHDPLEGRVRAGAPERPSN